MRCVSYTRTTSCKASENIPNDIIRQQNEHIQRYIQSHGWKLVAKYSDRKKDESENTAFEEMTLDGVNRKFDMVVVDSLDRCGKSISCAEDVLVKTFFPAGIHFTVVQDDFCSIGKSRNDVTEYARRERNAIKTEKLQEYRLQKQLEGYYTVHDEKYGYILSEDRKELIVEKEAAVIVREIFQLFLNGKSVKAIADIMNERGIESPMVHNARVGHKKWPEYENRWCIESVRRIIGCTAYNGYWKKTINGKVCTLPITPILEEGVFEHVQRIRGTVARDKKVRGGKPGPYSKRIFDKKTGKPLYFRRFQDGEEVYVLNSQIGRVPQNEETYIEIAAVTEKVKKAIQLEMDKAEKIKAYLGTEKMHQLWQEKLQGYSEEAWTIFREMEHAEHYRIPLYEEYRKGKIGVREYQEKKEEIQAQLQMYESDYERLMARYENMKRAYSPENKWLKTFQPVQMPEQIELQHVKKWVDKIMILDFKDVEVYLTNQEWKNVFPQEWLEG